MVVTATVLTSVWYNEQWLHTILVVPTCLVKPRHFRSEADKQFAILRVSISFCFKTVASRHPAVIVNTNSNLSNGGAMWMTPSPKGRSFITRNWLGLSMVSWSLYSKIATTRNNKQLDLAYRY
jgi:hypothetical protein